METWPGLAIVLFVERRTRDRKNLYSFPTRRSSDLHAVDKLVPAAPTKMEHGGAIGVYRIDAFDPTNPDRIGIRYLRTLATYEYRTGALLQSEGQVYVGTAGHG